MDKNYAEKGLILVDTKYEFDLIWGSNSIDEIHTPDSSRYWQANSHQDRITKGLEPENFDKEFLRLWFKDNCDHTKMKNYQKHRRDGNELSRRYVKICEQITGILFEINRRY